MMTERRVEELVDHFCAEEGLTNYYVDFSGTKTALGKCLYKKPVFNRDGSYNPKLSYVKLHFSNYYMKHVSLEEMIDTILHEIAHAVAGPRAGHGPQ